jgi:hypothetical protein
MSTNGTPAALDVMGVGEIADEFDVQTQTAHQWTRTKGFPDPVVMLRMGPIWYRTQINDWAHATGRRKPKRGNTKA